MNLPQKIFKNAFSNGVAFFVEAVTAFVMMPFVIMHLGDTSYGIWVLINAMTGYLGLFKLGFRPSINKHVAEYKATDDFSTMREYIGASLHIYIYLSLGIILTAVSVSYYVPVLFDLNQEFVIVLQILILFSGVQSVFSLIGTAYGGIISGYQRYEINAGIEIFVILIRAGLIFYFLPEFDSIYTVAIAHFSLTILGYLATIIVARIIAPVKYLNILNKPSKNILVLIVKYNSVSFLIAAIGIIISQVDKVIVGMILPLAVITHYAVGDRLVKYTIQFLSVVTRVIAPAISELKAKAHDDKVLDLLIYTHKISCVFAYPVLLCLIIQGEYFINIWMGEGYADSAKVMVVLALSAMFIAPSKVLNPFLYGLGKHKYLLYILMIEVCVSVPLCYFLGVEYGMIGVAIGLSVPQAVFRGFILPISLSIFLKSKIALRMYNSIIIVFLACIPFATLLYYAKELMVLDSWFNFIGQLIVLMPIYAFSIYLFVLSSKEKEYILSKLRRLKAKGSAND